MNALSIANKFATSKEDLEHVCPYIISHSIFKCKELTFNRPLHYRLTVDEEADLQLINLLYSALYKGKPIPNAIIYHYLESYPNLSKINAAIKQIRGQ
jgi:spore coat polysaccharide biosynthesis protein SpsF (cytidylyltransferase family)